MKKLLVLIAAVACASLFAEGEQGAGEPTRIEFLLTTGSQYVDTGYVPQSKDTRLQARFMVLERPEAAVGLLGTFAAKKTDGSVKTDDRNCAVTVNSDSLIFNWTGGTSDQFKYPASLQYDLAFAFELDVSNAWFRVNGTKRGGQREQYREDVRLGDKQTIFIGDANDSDGNPVTSAGSRPKVRWYGVKIWEGVTLVRDLVPAKKDGTAGFYDQVGKTFYPSLGDDFVVPNYLTWTGEVPGDWSAVANWSGATPGAADILRISAGTTAPARYEDVPFMSTTGGLLIEEGAKVVIENGAYSEARKFRDFNETISGVALQCAVYGEGTLENWNSKATESKEYALYLCGDNREFEGVFAFTNAAAKVVAPAGGGGAKTQLWFDSVKGTKSGVRNLSFTTGDHFCELHLVHASDSAKGATGTWLRGPIYLENSDGAFSFHGGGNTGEFMLDGPLTVRYAQGFALKPGSGLTGAEKNFGSGYASIEGINVPIAAKVSIGTSTTSNMKITNNSSAKFGVANAFPSDFYLELRSGGGNDVPTSSSIDLNGFDQQVGILLTRVGGSWKPLEMWDSGVEIRSETPAKLTVYDCIAGNITATTGYFIGRIRGAASFELNAQNDSRTPDGRAAKFAAPESDTTGGLFCRRGTITVESTATFPNLTKIEATGEGKIVLKTGNVGTSGDLVFVATNTATAGAVTLSDNLTLNAKSALVGGKWLQPGTYGGADAGLDPSQTLDCLAGTGTLVVSEYGGPKGLMILLR